jgi:pimeloyl-ACP methyl ester carboxylesterase
MRIDIDGVQFGYDEAGEGKPLLLLHGFPYQRGFWQPQLGTLKARTVAVDLPGFGESSDLSVAPRLEAYVAALRTFCDRFGLVRPAVAGHSFGGYIALCWARLHPEKLSGLALVASRATADTPEGATARISLAMRLEAGEAPEPIVEGMPARMLCRSRNTTEGQRMVRSLMDPLRPKGIADASRAMAARPDASAALADIALPALVLAGEQDQLIPLEESGIMAAALPEGRLTVPEGTGHFVSREAVAQSNAALDAWLARIPAP